MRKATTRTVLTVLAVLFLASKASAAPIAIGWLQWDASTSQFSVVNQTGANWLGDPFYPVVSQLAFNADLTLMVLPGNVNLTLNPTIGDATSRDSVPFVGAVPTQATLTGTVSPGVMSLDVNGDLNPNNGSDGPIALWNILNGGAIVDVTGNTVVLGTGQAPIGEFGFINLYVQGEPVQSAIPEPATLLLFGSGAMGLLARRRRSQKNAA